MTYITHLAASIVLLFSSLFGGHTSASTSVAVVPSHSIQSTAAASTTTTVANKQLASTKSASFLSSIVSIGTSVANSGEKVVQPSAPASVTPTTTPAPATVSSNTTTPTPTAAPTGVNTIDQTSVNAVAPNPAYSATPNITIYSGFTLSGHSSDATSVYVAVLPSSDGSTDWGTVNEDPSARISSASVSNGAWSVNEKGIVDGSYHVFVFNNTSTPTLLTSGNLNVAGSTSLGFAGYPGTPIVLGIGESATDGVVNIMLKSVSATGASISIASVTGTFTGGTYSATSGQQFPTATTGYNDSVSVTDAINIKVSSISTSAKTATLSVIDVQQSASATGLPPVEGE